MRIWYLRPSVFETNSSSSHALVYTMDFVEVEPTESSFGWEYFFLKSRKWKLVYFASQVRCMYREESSQVFSSVFTKDELAELLSKDFEYEVDHQSVWPAFRTPDGRPAVEFLKELKMFVVEHPFVAVIGGSDNTVDSGTSGPRVRDFPWWWSDRALVFRNGNYWVLFSSDDGKKMRVTFDGEAPKAEVPESIDLKITDYCEKECPWCYEGSSVKGKHAPFERICEFFQKIKGQVPEVAIGGGEPTKHPEFWRILQHARGCGIIPNFTTRSIEWLEDPVIFSTVKECVGCIGFSICTDEDLAHARVLSKSLKEARMWGKVVWHVVERVTPLRLLPKLPWGPVLILGYKKPKRHFLPLNERWTKKAILDTLSDLVMFDTKFVKSHQWTRELAQERPEAYAGDDGEFTIAVDLVENRVGRASYMPMRPLEEFSDARDLFKQAQQR